MSNLPAVSLQGDLSATQLEINSGCVAGDNNNDLQWQVPPVVLTLASSTTTQTDVSCWASYSPIVVFLHRTASVCTHATMMNARHASLSLLVAVVVLLGCCAQGLFVS